MSAQAPPGTDGRATAPAPGPPPTAAAPRASSGAAAAAKLVAEDVRDLVRAEVALAKAEAARAAKAKARGAALLAGAAVTGWLALQGLLIAVGFALALVVPGWAAASLVTVLLLAATAGFALAARGALAAPVSMETTKANVEEDVAWTKAHLRQR